MADLTDRLEYQPGLDGLRGLAVAAVVAFHLGYLQGGFLGVDMFFTLSGYLITRLLLMEVAGQGSISLGSFWSRRAWRLLPALYVMVAAVAVFAAVGASAAELGAIRGAGLATLLFVANWWFIVEQAGYWDEFALVSPLEHVWSLSIEQQFYLIWPVVVAACTGRGRSLRRLLALTLVLIVASTVLLGLIALDDVSRAYFGSFTRSGSILVGAALGIVFQRGDSWLDSFARSSAAPWVGLASGCFIALTWVVIDGATDTWFYVGGYLGHAVATAVIITLVTFDRVRVVAAVLRWRPLVQLGVVSYGLYLWHWPVIVVLNAERTGFGTLGLLTVRIVVSLGLTALSYVLIEQRARRRWSTRVRAAVVFPLAGVVVAAGLVVATREPRVSAVPAPPPATVPTTTSHDAGGVGADFDHDAELESTGTVTATDSHDGTEIEPVVTEPDDNDDGGLLSTIPVELPRLRMPTQDDPLRVLLVGDSYMYDATPGIQAAFGEMAVEVEPGAQLGFTITGEDWDERLADLMEVHRPELVIAMWARFDVSWLESDDGSAEAYADRLRLATEILSGGDAAVGYIGLAPSLTSGVDRRPVDRSINQFFIEQGDANPDVFYIDPDPIVAPSGAPERWLTVAEGDLLVRKVDVSHYCSDGAARFGLALTELVHHLTGAAVPDPASWWTGDWRLDARYDDPVGTCR